MVWVTHRSIKKSYFLPLAWKPSSIFFLELRHQKLSNVQVYRKQINNITPTVLSLYLDLFHRMSFNCPVKSWGYTTWISQVLGVPGQWYAKRPGRKPWASTRQQTWVFRENPERKTRQHRAQPCLQAQYNHRPENRDINPSLQPENKWKRTLSSEEINRPNSESMYSITIWYCAEVYSLHFLYACGWLWAHMWFRVCVQSPSPLLWPFGFTTKLWKRLAHFCNPMLVSNFFNSCITQFFFFVFKVKIASPGHMLIIVAVGGSLFS